MLEYPDASQSAELTPTPAPTTSFGRHFGTHISQIPKPRNKKVPPPQLEIFKRPIYLCPEMGRTCHRPGAYDAFDLPSLYADERKPHRFQD